MGPRATGACKELKPRAVEISFKGGKKKSELIIVRQLS